MFFQKEEEDGPYPPSANGNANGIGIVNPTTNEYPPNNIPNTSYGPPPSGSYQTTNPTGPTLGPPLAAYMINSRPLKSSRESIYS